MRRNTKQSIIGWHVSQSETIELTQTSNKIGEFRTILKVKLKSLITFHHLFNGSRALFGTMLLNGKIDDTGGLYCVCAQ